MLTQEGSRRPQPLSSTEQQGEAAHTRGSVFLQAQPTSVVGLAPPDPSLASRTTGIYLAFYLQSWFYHPAQPWKFACPTDQDASWESRSTIMDTVRFSHFPRTHQSVC